MCDLRVVEEDAVLGVFCRRVGIPLIDGGTIRLPRPDRHVARARSDTHRPRGERAGSARFWPREPRGRQRRGARGGRATGPPNSRPFRRRRCWPTAARCWKTACWTISPTRCGAKAAGGYAGGFRRRCCGRRAFYEGRGTSRQGVGLKTTAAPCTRPSAQHYRFDLGKILTVLLSARRTLSPRKRAPSARRLAPRRSTVRRHAFAPACSRHCRLWHRHHRIRHHGAVAQRRPRSVGVDSGCRHAGLRLCARRDDRRADPARSPSPTCRARKR